MHENRKQSFLDAELIVPPCLLFHCCQAFQDLHVIPERKQGRVTALGKALQVCRAGRH